MVLLFPPLSLVKLIQCPTTKIILPLWPTYFIPSNPQCTFSRTALKHYLHLPNVHTNHLKSLSISTYDGLKISFPSLPQPSFKIIINSWLSDQHTLWTYHLHLSPVLHPPLLLLVTSHINIFAITVMMSLIICVANNASSVYQNKSFQLSVVPVLYVPLLRWYIHLEPKFLPTPSQPMVNDFILIFHFGTSPLFMGFPAFSLSWWQG